MDSCPSPRWRHSSLEREGYAFQVLVRTAYSETAKRRYMSAELLGDPVTLKYYEERTPLRRIAGPEEVAAAIAFLLSDDASYCTSSELLVDGGFITNAEYL